MEYIHAALLLHSAGKEITVENIKAVLEAAGVQVDEAKAKALVASLEGVNIEEAIKSAQVVAAPAAGAPAGGEAKEEEKKKEEKKEEKKSEEEAAAGLASLFG